MYTDAGAERRRRARRRDRTDLLDLSRTRRRPTRRFCCGRVNRGLAILGDTLFHGHDRRASDRHRREDRAAALERRVVDRGRGYSITLAPLVVKDKVIVGTAGGEFGIRGFIAAFDAKTGKEAWRFNTVPVPGEPGHETWAGDSWKHGGAPIWVTGLLRSRDESHLLGHRQSRARLGRRDAAGRQPVQRLVVALDADTGKLKWHYQFTPARRVRLGLGAGSGAGRHRVAGPAAQGRCCGPIATASSTCSIA